MGNLCFKKNEPIYIPYYSPISPKISPIVNKSSNNPKKLKFKKCKHCKSSYCKYSPQLYCSKECKLIHENKI